MFDNPIVSTFGLCLDKLTKMEFTDERSINHAAELCKMMRRVTKRNPRTEFPQNIISQAHYDMFIRVCLDRSLVNTVLHKNMYKFILKVLLEEKRYKRTEFLSKLTPLYEEFCNLFDEIQPDGEYNTKYWIFTIMGSLIYTDTQYYTKIFPKFNIDVANELYYGNPYYCFYLYNLVRNPEINYEGMNEVVHSVIVNSASILTNLDATSKDPYTFKSEMNRASYCLRALTCCTRCPEIFIKTFEGHNLNDEFIRKLIEYDIIYGDVIDLLKAIMQIYTEPPFPLPIFGILFGISDILEKKYHLSKYINIAENSIQFISSLVERNLYVGDLAQQCFQYGMNMLITNLTEIGVQYAYLEFLRNVAKINISFPIVSDDISLQLAKAFIPDDEPFVALEFIILRLQFAIPSGEYELFKSILDGNDIEMIEELQTSEDEQVSNAAKVLSEMLSQIN